MVVLYFDVLCLFVKKVKFSILMDGYYEIFIYLFIKNIISMVIVLKEFLLEEDIVFIIDDFLVNGDVLLGLYDIV